MRITCSDTFLFKKQDPKSSLAEYTEGAKYRTPSAADLQAVASDYVLLKDYPDADQWFTKAVEWNPEVSLGWYYLGRTKYNENRFDEAIRAFQQCLKLDPRSVKAEDNLGLSYEGLNRTEEAIAAYRNAIAWEAGSAVNPDRSWTWAACWPIMSALRRPCLCYLRQAGFLRGLSRPSATGKGVRPRQSTGQGAHRTGKGRGTRS